MRVAFGLKAHSGWAALVVIGSDRGIVQVIDRRRLEFVGNREGDWAGQPYHAAEGKPRAQAHDIVKRGVDEARRLAQNELRSAIARARDMEHTVVACAVLMPAPMPDWSNEEILAVHMRMHKAEGVLYPDALKRAAESCGLNFVAVAEKSLAERVQGALGTSLDMAMQQVAALGKSVGAPWGADQKRAAVAAMIALDALRTQGVIGVK